MNESPGVQPAVKPTRSPFSQTFYVANIMEVFERLAWYGFFANAALYITSPADQGGLGFNEAQRGFLMGTVPFILYLLPVITGALADRYGYRKMFMLSFCIMAPSYYFLGQVNTFSAFLMVFLCIALGASIFKPVVVATVGKTTDDSNRGLGFGVFYTIVNIGGFLGPIIAGYMQSISWDMVFIMSGAWIAINFIPAFFLYKEPTSSSNDDKKSLTKVLAETQEVLGNARLAILIFPLLLGLIIAGGGWISYLNYSIFACLWLLINSGWNYFSTKEQNANWYLQKFRIGNGPFVLYLLILAGFWTSYNQLFITLPIYIRDFVDTHNLITFVAQYNQTLADGLTGINVDKVEAALIRAMEKTTATAQSDLLSLQLMMPLDVLTTALNHLKSLTPQDLNEAALAYANSWKDQYSQMKPTYLLSLNFGSIVCFQIIISSFIERWRPFPVLVAGTTILSAGLLFGGLAHSAEIGGIFIIGGVLIFSFGEMIASPKSQEYVAKIAPHHKTAMYMGYYFVCIALGNLFGGLLSGWSYEKFAKNGEPGMMWLLFAIIGIITAIALIVFDKTVVPTLEAQHTAEDHVDTEGLQKLEEV